VASIRPVRAQAAEAAVLRKSFRLLAKHELALTQKQPAGLGLATGGKTTLLFREKVEAKGKKPRLRLSVNLDDATTLVASGDVWLIGGESMAGERTPDATYVVAIACAVTKRPRRAALAAAWRVRPGEAIDSRRVVWFPRLDELGGGGGGGAG
jgi:hypothetical protein